MAWAPDYATSSDLKAYVRVADSLDDAQIALALSAASRAVDQLAGRQFGQVATEETRSYVGTWDRRLSSYVFEIDDLANILNLTVLAGTDEITDYSLHPLNAIAKGSVYTQLLTEQTAEVTVDALWGWPAVPASVKNATMLQANRFLQRRDSPFGIAGSPTDGSEMRLLAAVDPDVAVMLRPYKRNWWAA